MTHREEIIHELEAQSRSIDKLARLFRCSRREILADLKHVQHTLRTLGKRLYALPAVCNSCGEPINITRLKNIKCCPKCNHRYAYQVYYKAWLEWNKRGES